jgi:hypothetical protein
VKHVPQIIRNQWSKSFRIYQISHPQSSDVIGALATSGLSLSLLSYAGSLFWCLVGGGVYLLLKEKHHLDERELAGKGDIPESTTVA